MLHRLRQLAGFDVHSTTGHVGRVGDFFFDDHAWVVRYMVVDTGHWLSARQVLVSPREVARVDAGAEEVHVMLPKQQVEESPTVDAHQPINRQHEAELARYYGWPEYWKAVVMQTAAVGPPPVPPYRATGIKGRQQAGSPTLRSVDEVAGYRIEATDGAIGEVEDFVADAEWAIRYMMVDTRRWFPSRKVLIAPEWIEAIDWSSGRVRVELTKEGVSTSPPFDPHHPIDREYESKLHEHHGRAEYWIAGKHDTPVRIGCRSRSR